jgi:hypothetical protein
MKSVVALLSLTLLLCGCESAMQADVTQFSGAAPLPVGRNFVVSAEPAQSGSLEFQHYAGLVGGALQDHGFKAAAPGATPDLVVQIHYGSAGSHTDFYGDPWGWGPGWGWRHRGPYPYGPESKTFYGEMLEVEIFDGAAWRNNVHTMLYQGRAVGDATVNEISAAVPALVKALFTHFPGNTGQTERVVVPLPAPGGA